MQKIPTASGPTTRREQPSRRSRRQMQAAKAYNETNHATDKIVSG